MFALAVFKTYIIILKEDEKINKYICVAFLWSVERCTAKPAATMLYKPKWALMKIIFLYVSVSFNYQTILSK